MEDLKLNGRSAQEIYEIGKKYYDGINIEVDFNKAYKCFKTSAEMGNTQAMYSLHLCYNLGNGVDKDEAMALELLEKAANLGDAEAQCGLGYEYEHALTSIGFESLKMKVAFLRNLLQEEIASSANQIMESQDFEKGLLKQSENEYLLAIKWLTLSAEQGNVFAQYKLGYMYSNMVKKGFEDINRAKDAFYWFEKAASQGYDLAQLSVGECYLDGFGVEQDAEKGLTLMEQIAETSGIAQYNIGDRYRYGNGVERNEGRAIKWFLKALESGESWAEDIVVEFICSTAERIDDGDYDGDKSDCVDLYETAAGLGSSTAQCKLGEFYRVGQYIEQDIKKSFEWFEKSALQGNGYAQYRLGISYLFGDSIHEKDEVKGFSWLKKSLDQGSSLVQYALALCYWDGLGTDVDMKRAFDLFEMSSNQGNADAQYCLGIFYDGGIAVERDIKKSRDLWRKSADQGNEAAAKLLKEFDASDCGNKAGNQAKKEVRQKNEEDLQRKTSDGEMLKFCKAEKMKSTLIFLVVSILFVVSLAGCFIEIISGEPVLYAKLIVYVALIFFIKAFIRTTKWAKIIAAISIIVFCILIINDFLVPASIIFVTMPYLIYLFPAYRKILYHKIRIKLFSSKE